MSDPALEHIRNILWPTRAGIPLPERKCDMCELNAMDNDPLCRDCRDNYDHIWANPDQHHDQLGDNS